MGDYNYESLFAVAGIALLLMLLIAIPIIVLMIVAKCKMYKKAGKNGWEAIIPFYSDWVYVEISGLNWYWFFALIAGSLLSLTLTSKNGDSNISFNLGSLIALFGSFICNYNIAKKLHKDTGFAVLMTIFPIVLIPMIGFSSKYQFDNNVAVSPNGPFDSNKANNTSNEPKEDNYKFCPHCGNKLEKDAKFCPSCGKEV